MLYVEGTADRTLAWKLGVNQRQIIWANGKGGVLRQVVRQQNCRGLVDEDPTSPSQPNLLSRFVEVGTDELRRLGFRLYQQGEGGSALVMLCPKLEDWLIVAARDSRLRLDNRRYALPTNADHLHDVINNDLRKMERLLDGLLEKQSPRILRLQALLTG